MKFMKLPEKGVEAYTTSVQVSHFFVPHKNSELKNMGEPFQPPPHRQSSLPASPQNFQDKILVGEGSSVTKKFCRRKTFSRPRYFDFAC